MYRLALLTVLLILHSGCADKPRQTNSDSNQRSTTNHNNEHSIMLSNKVESEKALDHQKISEGSKKSSSKIRKTGTSQSDKYFDELRHAGINHQNINIFFHHSESYRSLMREKLLNSRDPYHQHIVWQKLKEMLSKNIWKPGFNATLNCLWECSEESFKIQILDHLLLHEKLVIIGRAPWTANQWLLRLKIPKKYDIHLLKALRISQHPARQWVRNYLFTRYKKNFGSNYLVWERYLKE